MENQNDLRWNHQILHQIYYDSHILTIDAVQLFMCWANSTQSIKHIHKSTNLFKYPKSVIYMFSMMSLIYCHPMQYKLWHFLLRFVLFMNLCDTHKVKINEILIKYTTKLEHCSKRKKTRLISKDIVRNVCESMEKFQWKQQ